MNIQFLPQKIHGMLDYAVALTLVVVPFVLDFRADSEFAHWLSVVAGVGLFVYSLATDYSVGVVSAITIRQHLALDFIAGALFVALAIVGGFSTEAAAFYGVVGAAVLAVVAVTKVDAPAAAAIA